jgi:hypothetical protein
MDQAPPSSPPLPAVVTIERGLQAQLFEGERLVAWGRAWVSTVGWFPRLLTARTLDFAVLSNGRLVLISTGFFTRRPRRRVYAMPLDRLLVAECEAKRGIRVRVEAEGRRPLLLEFRATPHNDGFVVALLAATPERQTAAARAGSAGQYVL